MRKLDPSGNFSFGRKQGDIVEDYVDGGIEAHGLKDSIRRLAALLEDIQGHFPELEPLHTHTKTLQRLLKVRYRAINFSQLTPKVVPRVCHSNITF